MGVVWILSSSVVGGAASAGAGEGAGAAALTEAGRDAEAEAEGAATKGNCACGCGWPAANTGSGVTLALLTRGLLFFALGSPSARLADLLERLLFDADAGAAVATALELLLPPPPFASAPSSPAYSDWSESVPDLLDLLRWLEVFAGFALLA